MTATNWRDFLSDPPRPHNLVEIMQTIILMAKEDAAWIERQDILSAREEFETGVGYDLYAAALELLDAPIFQAVDSEGEPTLPNEAQALSHIEPELPVGEQHSHDIQCCREHGTHSNPHRGCILR